MRTLFVCTGNICRSPTADAILRARIAALGLPFTSDSAGTHGYHIGDLPDSRTRRIAAMSGIAMDALRARQVSADDFHAFDLILAMDQGHLTHLRRLAPPGAPARLALFLEESGLAGAHGFDVPDPYYGGLEGFEQVFRLIEKGVDGLIDRHKPL